LEFSDIGDIRKKMMKVLENLDFVNQSEKVAPSLFLQFLQQHKYVLSPPGR
jgi:hypothetical protein